jgi:mannose-6-phosphate isomerase-like protein (cupin superfamily)
MVFIDVIVPSASVNALFNESRWRVLATASPRILRPTDGTTVSLASIGARFMVNAAESGGGFALIEHPMRPRSLGSPLHRHSREDEYSYVLEGRVGVQLGDEVIHGEPGDLVFKPRGQWHAFWNPGDEPARILEIISPAGFEQYFARVSEVFAADGEPDAAALAAIAADHGLELDIASIPRLSQEHGLR